MTWEEQRTRITFEHVPEMEPRTKNMNSMDCFLWRMWFKPVIWAPSPINNQHKCLTKAPARVLSLDNEIYLWRQVGQTQQSMQWPEKLYLLTMGAVNHRPSTGCGLGQSVILCLLHNGLYMACWAVISDLIGHWLDKSALQLEGIVKSEGFDDSESTKVRCDVWPTWLSTSMVIEWLQFFYSASTFCLKNVGCRELCMIFSRFTSQLCCVTCGGVETTW